MKTHLIVSVGTSIVGNYKKAIEKLPYLERRSLNIKEVSDNLELDNYERSLFPKPSSFCEDYSDLSQILTDDKNQGAEQQSIGKLELTGLDARDCHFHLIATKTASCLFCASFIGHEVLKHGKLTCHIPPGLEDVDDQKFADKGLPSLLSCVADILNDVEEKGDKAVIVPTGGYKIMVPYLTIASILYKLPAYYIYESSRNLIELPAPPLGINTSEFRSVMVLLENIIGLDTTEASPYYNALPESFQRLVYIDNGCYKYNAFGERLKTLFIRQDLFSPLMVRAADNSLVPYMGKYSDIFRNLAKLGENVWLGDKAPEMADHARHHHTNLFSYTELLLLPILNNEKKFLTEEELFLLLGMVYLHDCGHSLCSLPESNELVPLLPTEIRNFHNFLGFIRLKDPAFHKILAHQGLEMKSSVLDNIAMISLYHRKKMPLSKGMCTTPDKTDIPPLCSRKIHIDDRTIKGNRLALMVSFFRIIDGMDKQIGRSGDAVEISMKAEAILSDLPYLWDRVKRLKSALTFINKNAEEKADQLLIEIIEDYGLKETVISNDGQADMNLCCGCKNSTCSFEPNSPPVFSETTFYTRLHQALAKEKLESLLPITWEYLEARVRFFFKALQPSYYHSDILLGMPRVTHCMKNGLRHIIINYPENTDISGTKKQIERIWEKIQIWIKNNVDFDAPEQKVLNASLARPLEVVKGIRDEYCSKKNSEVAATLFDAGVTIEFQYGGETVPCWKERPGNN